MGTSSQRASASRPLLVSERGGALVLDDPTRGLFARLFDRLAAEARPGRAPLGRVHGVVVDREGVTVLATPEGARVPRRVRVGASHLAAVRLRISHGEASGARLAFTAHAERDCVFDCAVSGVEGREAAEALAFRLARASGLTHYRLRELGEHEIDLELVPGSEGAYRGVAALPIPAPGERLDAVASVAPEAPPASALDPLRINDLPRTRGSFFVVEGWEPGVRAAFYRAGMAAREGLVLRLLRYAGAIAGTLFNAAVLGLLLGVIALLIVALPWLLVTWFGGSPVFDYVALAIVVGVALATALWSASWLLPTYLEPPVTAYHARVDWARRAIELEEADHPVRVVPFDEILAVALRARSERAVRIDLVCKGRDHLLFEHRFEGAPDEPRALASRLAEVLAAELGVPFEA